MKQRKNQMLLLKIIFTCSLPLTLAFNNQLPATTSSQQAFHTTFFAFEGGAPSDYDSNDLVPDQRNVAVASDSDYDATLREELKRELLLFASVTNRGDYASNDERSLIIDIVNQLEALNPTPNPSSCCEGEWDLALCSTQTFRSSPFFQTIRVLLGDNNKAIAENGFEIHDLATSASRIGRVRQVITSNSLVSEVDLEVGMVPGLPFRVKGTVVTDATLDIVSPESWQTRINKTMVKGSNIPLFNQFLDDKKLELPVGEVYKTVSGNIPVVTLKTFYVDQGIRITRDVDDNFFVFSRV